MDKENSLEMLVTTAHGIARHFGKDCEVCIHDIGTKDLDHTIVFIVNGHVTGRSVGDGASKVVLETLEALEKGECIVDHLGYRIQTQDGRILKSSTILLLDSLINESVKKIGKPPALMNKEEKIRAIHFLRDAGAFLITRSGDKVSNFYGISKFTLYSYIDQSKR